MIGRELAKCKGDKEKVNSILRNREINYKLIDNKFINTEYEHNWINIDTCENIKTTLKRLMLEEKHKSNFIKFRKNDDIEFVRVVARYEGYEYLKECQNNGIELQGTNLTNDRLYIIFLINRSNTYVCVRPEWLKSDKNKHYVKDSDGNSICIYYEESLSYKIENTLKKEIEDVLDIEKNKKEKINPDIIYANSSSNKVYAKCCNGIGHHKSFLITAANLDGNNCSYCYTSGHENYVIAYEDSLKNLYPDVSKDIVCDEYGKPVDSSKIKTSSHKKVYLRCSCCGEKLKEVKTIDKAVREGYLCCKCKDGKSLGEKFNKNIFQQLEIYFESEKTFPWAIITEDYVKEFLQKYEYNILKEIEKRTGEKHNNLYELVNIDNLTGRKYYDLFVDYKKNSAYISKNINKSILAEDHGRQHYQQAFRAKINKSKKKRRNVYEEITNDLIKKTIAESNGMIYIEIDCRDTSCINLEKQLKQSLGHLFDLQYIDWKKAYSKALSSIKKDIWYVRNQNMNVTQISDKLDISRGTVIDALKIGTELGKLKFPYNPQNDEGYNGEHGRQEVYIIYETYSAFINTIKLYLNLKECNLNITKNKNLLKCNNDKKHIEDILKCNIKKLQNDKIKLSFKSKKNFYKDFLNISFPTFKKLCNENTINAKILQNSQGKIEIKKCKIIESLDGVKIIFSNPIYKN